MNAELAALLSSQQAGGAPVQVERLDPKRDGGLFVEARLSGATRWFSVHEGRSQPLDPDSDARLPLSQRVPALRAAGPLEVLAYRPERRLVLRLGELGATSGLVVLKGYRKRQYEESARLHGIAAASLGEQPLRLPRLQRVDAAAAALEFEFVAGRPISLAPRHADQFRRVGAALRRLQAGPAEGLSRHGPAEELAIVDALAARARAVGVNLPPAHAEVARRVHAGVPSHGDVLAPAHRDLHDGQLLSARDGLVVLDFDLLCLADPLLDAANLVAHLKLRELQGLRDVDESTVDVCGRALLEGLDREADVQYRERLRFYQAATFLRLSLVYALRRRWAHLSPELLELARRCVDDR